MLINNINIWVARPFSNPQARLRLFCLPYAGGGASTFSLWARLLPPTIELCPIILPGRESRLRETPYKQLLPLVETLTEALYQYLDKPVAFFGHSMGALICFELIRQLRRQHAPNLVHLFVSGRNAPHVPDQNLPLHSLPDAVFIEKVQHRYKGIPAAVLQNLDLMQLFLPTLRADFSMFETYIYTDESPLDIPISAFGGQQDSITNREGLAAWRNHTKRAFCLRMLPGEHFFLQTAQESLLQSLTRDLSHFLGKPPKLE